MNPSNHLRIFDALRGLLAVNVLVSHAYLLRQEGDPCLIGLSAHESVLCFFILSGFAITWSAMRSDRLNLIDYFKRRAFRIVPAYWLALAIGTLYFACHSPSSIGQIGPSLLAHATLTHCIVPHAEFGLLGPSWSLTVEEQFYAFMPLVLWALLRRKWIWYFAGLGAFFFMMASSEFHQYPVSLPVFAPFFLIGISTAVMASSSISPRIRAAHIFFLALAFWLVPKGQGAPVAAWTIACAVQFSGMAETHLTRLAGILGSLSYSLYLFHMPIQYTIQTIFPDLSGCQLLAISGPLSLLVSWLVFRFVESTVIAWAKQSSRRDSRRGCQPTMTPSLVRE